MKVKRISSNIISSLKDVESRDLCLGSKKENDRNVELLRAGEQVMSSGGSKGGPPLYLGQIHSFFETAHPRPLPLSQGLDDRAPPLSEGLDPPLRVTS